ncbi:MAG: FkbM family methyltransferase [Rickettsiales bacterium]|jgi:FkbM family methyltransferase|nr:FkbM family methyltransferase [Rickettsiales bacterium]
MKFNPFKIFAGHRCRYQFPISLINPVFPASDILADIAAMDPDSYRSAKEKLFSGLDDDSIRILQQVFDRYELTLETGQIEFNMSRMTAAEVIFGETVMRRFYKDIKTRANHYEWRGFKLPHCARFEPSVFLTNHGLDSVPSAIRLNENPDLVILDVGGSAGDSCLIFRKRFPNNKIISFEPIGANVELAKQTIALNNLQNVKIENIALTDILGDVWFDTDCAGAECQESRIPGVGAKCAAATLDSWIIKNPMRIGMIKIDVEGGEHKFLDGAMETIKRDRPILLLSIYHNLDQLLTIKPRIEALGLGYKLHIFKPVDTLFLEILLIAQPE